MLNLTNDNPNPYQLPNMLRETMLHAGITNGLVVLEGLYMLRLKSDSWLTFDQIYRLCRDNFGTSYQLVYKGLQQSQIFQRRKAQGKAGQRGARPYLYRLPHPDELIAEFSISNKYSPHDTLRKSDLKSVSTYRKGLHRQLFIRKWIKNGGKGFVMSRQLMARRLAVSIRTVRTYDKCLGHSHEPNYKEVEITQNNWYKLPRYKDKFDANGKRLPSKVWLKTLQYGDYAPKLLPCVRYLAYKALNEGRLVWAVERLPNTYYPYQKPDLSQLDRHDVLAHFYAEKDARAIAGLHRNNDGTWYHRLE